MSQSPYAGTMSPGGYEMSPAARTSVMAVLAVVFAILCLPPTGLLAILLGTAALMAIGRSQGKLEGRGAAISGIILGLITTVLWGALMIGVLQAWTYYSKQMIPTGDRFFRALVVDDFDGARNELDQDTSGQITNDQLAAFLTQVEDRLGEVEGVATTTDAMTRAMRSLGNNQQQSRSGNTVTVQPNNGDMPVPMLLLASGENAFIIIVFDHDSVYGDGSTGPKIVDVAIILSNEDVIALRTAGPASSAADQISDGEVLPREDAEPESSEPELPDPADNFPTPDPVESEPPTS